MTEALVHVDSVTVDVPLRSTRLWRRHATLRAVDGVTLRLLPTTTTGLVGESGAGKTTLANTIIGERTPTSGTVRYEGRDIATLRGHERKRFRRDVQVIFQDPASALNPRMTLRQIVAEPMLVHELVGSRLERSRAADALLDRCGLPASLAEGRPYELSGGQRQRVALARALAARPCVIVADEPTSALDVSIQAQILGLLRELQEEHHIALLLISHDLGVIRQMADDVAIMADGRIVEAGPAAHVFDTPTHPYTRHLLASYVLDPGSRR